jgi:hypothetical protein
MAQEPESFVRINISYADAEDFIKKLASDDDFRSDVEADPRGMLVEVGIDISPDLVPETVTLPSKESLQSIIAVMQFSIFGPCSPAFIIICKVFPAFPLVAADEEGDGAR